MRTCQWRHLGDGAEKFRVRFPWRVGDKKLSPGKLFCHVFCVHSVAPDFSACLREMCASTNLLFSGWTRRVSAGFTLFSIVFRLRTEGKNHTLFPPFKHTWHLPTVYSGAFPQEKVEQKASLSWAAKKEAKILPVNCFERPSHNSQNWQRFLGPLGLVWKKGMAWRNTRFSISDKKLCCGWHKKIRTHVGGDV